jgi:hypothetical protein
MLRRTVANLAPPRPTAMPVTNPSNRRRYAHDLMYKGEGKTHSGFRPAYAIWAWKQRELFRNIQEAQFEHTRRVYKRQWLEAYRVNASEYLYKYSITRAAQMAQWEREMEAQESKRRDAYQMSAGRRALRAKHQDLLRELHERQFFHWYERASERLQAMAHNVKYVAREDLDAVIAGELGKYQAGSEGAYPLNFVGQMPFLEDADGNVVAAPRGMQQRLVMEGATGVKAYDAPVTRGTDAPAADISADLVFDADDASAADDAFAASVLDQMAQERGEVAAGAATLHKTEDAVTGMDDAASRLKRRMYIERGKAQSKRFVAGGTQAKNLEVIVDVAPVAAVEAEAQAALRSERAQEGGGRKRKAPKPTPRPEDVPAVEGGSKRLSSAEYQRAQQQGADTSMVDVVRRAVEASAADAAAAGGKKKGEKGTIATAGKLQMPKFTEELVQQMMAKTGGNSASIDAVKNKKRKP